MPLTLLLQVLVGVDLSLRLSYLSSLITEVIATIFSCSGGYGVQLVRFVENIVLVECGVHQLVFGDVVPAAVLVPLCLRVVLKIAIRGNSVNLEEVDHKILFMITPFLQPIHVYLDILIIVINIGVDSGHICVQVGHIFSEVSFCSTCVYDGFILHQIE